MNWQDISPREIVPGYFGRFLHTGNTTIAYWEVLQNAALQEHAHMHTQTLLVLKGEFQLTVEGQPHVLKEGDLYHLDSNVPHAGLALTDCVLIDVFSPEREDLKEV